MALQWNDTRVLRLVSRLQIPSGYLGLAPRNSRQPDTSWRWPRWRINVSEKLARFRIHTQQTSVAKAFTMSNKQDIQPSQHWGQAGVEKKWKHEWCVCLKMAWCNTIGQMEFALFTSCYYSIGFTVSSEVFNYILKSLMSTVSVKLSTYTVFTALLESLLKDSLKRSFSPEAANNAI